MGQQIQRDCSVCGGEYVADLVRLSHGRGTTCSRACSYKLRALALSNPDSYATLTCHPCGVEFSRLKTLLDRAKHGKYSCSKRCSYINRTRVVLAPYTLVSQHSRREACIKAWETRRANPNHRTSTELSRATSRATLIKNLSKLGGVSNFERKVSSALKALGFNVSPSSTLRNSNGTFACVFDILLPERRLVIECHGDYWHGGRWSWETPNPAQKRNLFYEEAKLSAARALGLDIRILWESDFKRDKLAAILAAVR